MMRIDEPRHVNDPLAAEARAHNLGYISVSTRFRSPELTMDILKFDH